MNCLKTPPLSRFYIFPSSNPAQNLDSIQQLLDVTVEAKAKQYATAAIGATSDHDIAEECTVRDKILEGENFGKFGEIELIRQIFLSNF